MQAFQTDGAPPKIGSSILAVISCRMKERQAASATATMYESSRRTPMNGVIVAPQKQPPPCGEGRFDAVEPGGGYVGVAVDNGASKAFKPPTRRFAATSPA